MSKSFEKSSPKLSGAPKGQDAHMVAANRSEWSVPLPLNRAELVGRVSSLPVERELPSGDRIVEFRIVIDRFPDNSSFSRANKKIQAISTRSKSEPVRKKPSPQPVKRREIDTLDIAVWGSQLRKKTLKFKVDDWVHIEGAVRRRFWQAPHGLASRWQVEALDIELYRAPKASE